MRDRMTIYFFILWFTLTLGACASAQNAPPRVYLNDIDITGMRSQEFKDVDVLFDSVGNVRITSSRLSVKSDSANDGYNTKVNTTYVSGVEENRRGAAYVPLPEKSGDRPLRRYYVLAMTDKPSLIGFDVEVYVNDVYACRLYQSQEQNAVEITQYLQKGNNKITYRPVLSAGAGRSSKAEFLIQISYPDPKNKTDKLILVGEEAQMKFLGGDDESISIYRELNAL